MVYKQTQKIEEISYIAQMAEELAKIASDNEAEVLAVLLETCAREGRMAVRTYEKATKNKLNDN
ncbi:hypothetical protein [Bartonella sp. TP]|uniref:hypothetical protein n=1 Tax=Bartonella sp. TP TaxID=3057550 RepID=UPI0025B14E17|nr:hypothetical protein [Bartonella sp. TP]WJW79641.1 hypothetical protein QVL57_03730 [Bartonella sp. TP]